MKSAKSNEKIDIRSFLTMMDVASELRKQKEEVNKQLNIDETKADLRQRILETSKVTGENLNDAEAMIAIESYFSGLYSFKEPKKNFSHSLANLYVDREMITDNYVKPAAFIAGVAILIYATAGITNLLVKQSREKKIEDAVEQGYKKKLKLQGRLNALKSSHDSEVIETAKASGEILKGTDEFFKEYCSNGTSDDDINQQNYKTAQKQLQIADADLNKANEYLNKGEGIIKFGNDLVSTRKSLELLISEIKNSNPPKQLMTQAESDYQNGIASVDKKNLSQAKEYYNHLNGIKTDAQEFAVLPSQAEKLYNTIKAVAVENAAIEQADNLYKEAKASAENVNVKQLKQAVDNLGTLDNLLEQDYTMTVVSKEGVKSGIDRYYTDGSGKRLSGYYLIIEAKDSKGNALQKQIKNEENGQAYNVTMWGERVPQEIYERIKQDKMNDGIVNDNVFGKKQRGYVTESITIKGLDKRLGQITSW
jgi:hypothetical protein